MPENQVRPLTKEEMEALTKDLQEVLAKHGADMGVTSTITLTKSPIPSPYATNNGEEAKKEEDNSSNGEAEASSKESDREPDSN